MKPSKWTILCWCWLVLGSWGLAQNQPPRTELFGGYSYATLDLPLTGHGWGVSLSRNFHKNFGVTADLSGHYHRSRGLRISSHAFVFGPRVIGRTGRVTGFGHALFGFAHRRTSDREPPRLSPFFQGPLFGPLTGSGVGFAMNFGAGVDVGINDRVAVRVLQLDVHARRARAEGWSPDLRVQTGIVLKFGH
jgi:hypothetical protein